MECYQFAGLDQLRLDCFLCAPGPATKPAAEQKQGAILCAHMDGTVISMIVCSTDGYAGVTAFADGQVKAGASLLEVKG